LGVTVGRDVALLVGGVGSTNPVPRADFFHYFSFNFEKLGVKN